MDNIISYLKTTQNHVKALESTTMPVNVLVNGIRFHKNKISNVQFQYKGIWLEECSYMIIKDEIMLFFSSSSVLVNNRNNTFHLNVGLLFKTINLAYDIAQKDNFVVDDYCYPNFFIIEDFSRSLEPRLNETSKKQIYILINFIIEQYFVFKKHALNSNHYITVNRLMAGIYRLIYTKDSEFQRDDLYFNTGFYLYPIHEDLIEVLINKSNSDFKDLIVNGNCVFNPKGHRDEEEELLCYIDTIIIREFFRNKFIDIPESNQYFEFVPNIVERLYNKYKQNYSH